MSEPLETLRKIARHHLSIPTLELRNSDRQDFHEVYVGGLRGALLAAYEAGQSAAGKPDGMTVRAILLDAASKALAHAQAALSDEGSASAATARTRYAMAILDALEAVALYVDHGEGR